MRWVLIASSLLIRAKKALAITLSWVRNGPFSSWANRSSGSISSHLARTAAENRASLSPKWLYTVSLETPASAAIWSMLAPLKPSFENSRLAASRIAARLPKSLGRPGLAGLVAVLGRLAGDALLTMCEY